MRTLALTIRGENFVRLNAPTLTHDIGERHD
jgi:hypothetical protein